MNDLPTETPAQERFAQDVLSWGRSRPRWPPDLVPELQRRLEGVVDRSRGALAAFAERRSGRGPSIGRKVLERRICDGWQRDPEPFQHSWASVRADLAREAIGVEWEAGRQESSARLAARVWHDAATRDAGDPGSRSAWMNRRTSSEAETLCAEVAALLDDLREVWPVLPGPPVLREVRRPVEVVLGDGVVTLYGRPDLVLDSSVEDGRARALLVDLRTGRPRPVRDREALRFHALLVTLRRGRPPFRWVSHHVTEGRSEVEDLGADALEEAAGSVVEVVEQLARLGAGEAEQLSAGPWCVDCRRRDTCEVARRAGTDRATDGMSHPGVTIEP